MTAQVVVAARAGDLGAEVLKIVAQRGDVLERLVMEVEPEPSDLPVAAVDLVAELIEERSRRGVGVAQLARARAAAA